jgi:polyphosphate kinase
VVTPVTDAAARATLDEILTRELSELTGWVLNPDGSYSRRSAERA